MNIKAINLGTGSSYDVAEGLFKLALPYDPQLLVEGNNFYVVDYNFQPGIYDGYSVYVKLASGSITESFIDMSNTPPKLLGLTQTNGILINGNYQGFNGLQILNPPSDSTSSKVFNPDLGSLCIQFLPTPTQIPVPGGQYDIFTYQEYLNQINIAFQKCFTNMKTQLGAAFLPTEPPSVIYNPQTKLFNLIVEGQYLTTNPDGSNQYTIFMNDNLWDKFYFPSSGKFDQTYNAIILQNYGINAVVGTGSTTLPQFIYIQQEDSTIYAFYDLVRLIVGTTRIPVSGDGEGKTFSNNGFASNNAISMITDIVPDTTTLTPGSVLIYIPEGILRWYNLYAQQPFEKVDLILYYETKDGNIYPIDIINNEFFSVKLEFKKGPGDF